MKNNTIWVIAAIVISVLAFGIAVTKTPEQITQVVREPGSTQTLENGQNVGGRSGVSGEWCTGQTCYGYFEIVSSSTQNATNPINRLSLVNRLGAGMNVTVNAEDVTIQQESCAGCTDRSTTSPFIMFSATSTPDTPQIALPDYGYPGASTTVFVNGLVFATSTSATSTTAATVNRASTATTSLNVAMGHSYRGLSIGSITQSTTTNPSLFLIEPSNSVTFGNGVQLDFVVQPLHLYLSSNGGQSVDLGGTGRVRVGNLSCVQNAGDTAEGRGQCVSATSTDINAVYRVRGMYSYTRPEKTGEVAGTRTLR